MNESSAKNVQEVRVSDVRFLREQDGPNERVLKQDLILLFNRNECIKKAFLARVAYGPNVPEGVALCVKSIAGPDMELVKSIQLVFASTFRKTEHLDILFVDAAQELEIAGVCLPFYEERRSP
jgi:hypothetical protein